jgi:hypothetical protein
VDYLRRLMQGPSPPEVPYNLRVFVASTSS